MSDRLTLWRMNYVIGKKDVGLSVDNKNQLNFWCGNWSDASVDLAKPIDPAEVLAGITWAIKQAAGREPTADEIADMRYGVSLFFTQELSK